MHKISFISLLVFCFSCSSGKKETNHPEQEEFEPYVERMSVALDAVIPVGGQVETIAKGFVWSEGPLWIDEEGGYLIFSDVPANTIFKWKEGEGVSEYLKPSGLTLGGPASGEPGSNGLALTNDDRLIMCQHGDRRVAVMDSKLSSPQASFITIADAFEGKKFNSPNDLIVHSTGAVFFTDPPYGLSGQMEDSGKELSFQGVFRADINGDVTLLTDQLSRPNGIAIFPGEQTLIVANSDPEHAVWMAYDLSHVGDVSNGRIFYDATSRTRKEEGLPDGLTISRSGVIFASGPGGIFIFDEDANILGMIRTGQHTSSCALTSNEDFLYITANKFVMRVPLSVADHK